MTHGMALGATQVNALEPWIGAGRVIKSPVIFSTHIESFTKAQWELEPLFEDHYKEISLQYSRGIKLNPDWKEYQNLEQQGKVLFVALRKFGQLVGYFNGFVGRDLHYQILCLKMDLIYVHPSARGESNGQHGGRMLIEHAKEEASRRGVKLFTAGYKSFRGRHMKKLLEDGGFEPFEVHYVLWL